MAQLVAHIIGNDEVPSSNLGISTKEFHMSDGGKGSKPRPFSVSDIEYANRWDAIFHKDKTPEVTPEKARAEEALQKLHDENVKLGLY